MRKNILRFIIVSESLWTIPLFYYKKKWFSCFLLNWLDFTCFQLISVVFFVFLSLLTSIYKTFVSWTTLNVLTSSLEVPKREWVKLTESALHLMDPKRLETQNKWKCDGLDFEKTSVESMYSSCFVLLRHRFNSL